MKFNKPLKLLIGLVTLWPLIHMGSMVILVFFANSDSTAESILDTLFSLPYLMIGALLISLFFCFVYLSKYTQINHDSKVTWGFLFFFVGQFAMPVFWYLYVWRKRDNQDNHTCPKCSNSVTDTWKVCPNCGEFLSIAR